MRRLLPSRRRRARRSDDTDFSEALTNDIGADEFAPFVPVEASAAYETLDDEAMYTPPVPERRARRRLPRRQLPRPSLPRIHVQYLVLVVCLVAEGGFATLLNLDRVGGEAEMWWPAVILAGAVLWMGAALARRRVASFLGACALAGLGLSLLMNSQDIAEFEETVMGVMLVTVGLGIIVQGLVLRQRASL
ncbi:MAG: hypothetical protein GYB65_03905 [Chloroflexi bacterium]|nr:hypothetical protein [Chloroflexota bacterium]